ncbi:hypothetical protein ACWT_0552 [Actinoplanes sp. SE50]|uniref:hypothetical protein n=1 Tax=Actinoplanes sp. SE50 TaxID=2033844 RepID=UPI00023ECDD2|nr:hypothetical protein [Actinoplanes sp. SE50]AEV81565.1 hypothetical protein ACPL_668 [Actinoplanes sp. SE50/110]ATO79967.1 hypothetical protein ACWT_0552 [Actinoplanes sp. SE50]SLL97369.1 hypothetical protein ACSP50_0571 [Actinoplanes sp. SE50/110]
MAADSEEVETAAKPRRHQPPFVDSLVGLPGWEQETLRRGIDFVTYRRIADALGLVDVAALESLLAAHHPTRDTDLLWKVEDARVWSHGG